MKYLDGIKPVFDNQMTAYFRKFVPQDLAGGVIGNFYGGVSIYITSDEPKPPIKHIPVYEELTDAPNTILEDIEFIDINGINTPHIIINKKVGKL